MASGVACVCVCVFRSIYPQVNCTDAVLATIAKAGAAGGGVVAFGLGRYYVSGALILPQNVRLIGAGMGKTAIYFEFSDRFTVPESFIDSEVGASRYGVADLDLYLLRSYNNIIFNLHY
eukprot:COSAG03_NODE_1432_length_4089_cov_11.519298_5_plen_119_part_00